MSWEIFAPSPRPTRRINGAVLSINKNGLGILSFDAYEAMGKPERVHLLWDAEAQQVGIRPAASKDETAYRVHPTARSFQVGSLLEHYALNHLRQQRVHLDRADSVWTFSAGGAS